MHECRVFKFFLFQGLTPIDLAESDMEKYLEELKKKQMEKPKINVCN